MAEEQAAAGGKWEGKTTAELTGVNPDQIWPFIADFSNLQKWLSSFLSSSRIVEGTNGEVGAVRRNTMKGSGSGDDDQDYIEEKLVELDNEGRRLSYQVLANSVGMPVGGYVATMRVLDSPGGGGGCKLEWSFVSEPMADRKLEDFRGFLEALVKPMAELMEATAKANSAAVTAAT